MKLTNIHGISLPLAVWLLHDEYDYIDDPRYISATSLLKSTRQLVLSKRVKKSDIEIDISTFLASRMGTAIHDSIEKAWRDSGQVAMKKLGYPPAVYENIVVNPTPEQMAANPSLIPVWMEQRAIREIDGYKIGGKFDMILQGRLFDAKSTSVYAYLLGRKDDDYAKQGGIYRWLNPELVTDDKIFIQFIFTDWQKGRAKGDANYPQTKAIEYPVDLPSLEETEKFISAKLSELDRYWNSPDEEIPFCTDKELWRSQPVYKYFSNPDKTDGRATRNFDNDKAAAEAHLAEKGGKGVVIEKPGEVKACEYCPAFTICKQKDFYYVA
jgi:hypothetical protein